MGQLVIFKGNINLVLSTRNALIAQHWQSNQPADYDVIMEGSLKTFPHVEGFNDLFHDIPDWNFHRCIVEHVLGPGIKYIAVDGDMQPR